MLLLLREVCLNVAPSLAVCRVVENVLITYQVRWGLLSVFLVFVLSSCSSMRHEHIWEERYIVAARAQDTGNFDEAAMHFEQLEKHAPDEKRKRLIDYHHARMLEQQDREQEALVAYQDVYDVDFSDEPGANAMYRAANLHRSLGDVTLAIKLYNRLIEQHGKWVVSEHALAFLEEHYAQTLSSAQMEQKLVEYLVYTEGTPLQGYVFFRIAALQEKRTQYTEALETYDKILAQEHLQVLWDDALWEKANLLDEQANWEGALVAYERLATKFQEESWFVGDYSSEHADQARMRRGTIYLDELGLPKRAVREFDVFLSDFEYNKLRDDVAWLRLRALREAGEVRAYERGLERFVKDYPESRYQRKLKEGVKP